MISGGGRWENATPGFEPLLKKNSARRKCEKETVTVSFASSARKTATGTEKLRTGLRALRQTIRSFSLSGCIA